MRLCRSWEGCIIGSVGTEGKQSYAVAGTETGPAVLPRLQAGFGIEVWYVT